MNNLKSKWEDQEQAVKLAIGAGAAIAGLVFVVKILPALVAALGIGAFLAILFLPFWLPTIIAFYRKHPSKGGILALNFFLGWTFVGWIVALVWALSDNTGRAGTQSVIVNTTVNASAGAPPPPHYQVGDVINGHRFDGAAWVPTQTSQQAPPVPPAAPAATAQGDGQTAI
ncbi:MAG TPA: superinfection immunity protein [Solirubrobacteraceae bacterium]|jgi:hypothetical protein|nr:superinfection immunity protein [Solirubrobacteraceae bacterium]